MYVCICNAVSDTDIRRHVEDGVRSFDQLQEQTACSTCCGCCETEARRTLHLAVHAVQTAAAPLTSAA